MATTKTTSVKTGWDGGMAKLVAACAVLAAAFAIALPTAFAYADEDAVAEPGDQGSSVAMVANSGQPTVAPGVAVPGSTDDEGGSPVAGATVSESTSEEGEGTEGEGNVADGSIHDPDDPVAKGDGDQDVGEGENATSDDNQHALPTAIEDEAVSAFAVLDAHGGSLAIDSKLTIVDGKATLPGKDAATREGYVLAGWSTDPDATEAEYAPDEEIDATDGMKLYAVWAEVAQYSEKSQAPEIMTSASGNILTGYAGTVAFEVNVDTKTVVFKGPGQLCTAADLRSMVSKNSDLSAVWAWLETAIFDGSGGMVNANSSMQQWFWNSRRNDGTTYSNAYQLGNKLHTLDVSGLDMSSCTDMTAFMKASTVTSFKGYENWDVSNVLYWDEFMYNAAGLKELDLGDWHFRDVKGTRYDTNYDNFMKNALGSDKISKLTLGDGFRINPGIGGGAFTSTTVNCLVIAADGYSEAVNDPIPVGAVFSPYNIGGLYRITTAGLAAGSATNWSTGTEKITSSVTHGKVTFQFFASELPRISFYVGTGTTAHYFGIYPLYADGHVILPDPYSIEGKSNIKASDEENKRITGWYSSSYNGTLMGGLGEVWTGTGDIKLYAGVSDRINITIEYLPGVDASDPDQATGSTASNTGEVAYDLTTNTNGFSRRGYTFKCWNLDYYGNVNEGILLKQKSGLKLTNNQTIYATAVWEPKNTYIVKFNTNGGDLATLPDRLNVKWTSTTLDQTGSNPTREGYDFIGWWYGSVQVYDKSTSLGKTYGDLVRPSEPTSITLTAHWAEKSSTIRYRIYDQTRSAYSTTIGRTLVNGIQANSETVSSVTGVPLGATADSYVNGVYTGYAFLYWTLETNLTTSISTNATLSPTEIKNAAKVAAAGGWEYYENTVTFVAHFGAGKYTVHFNPDGGTGGSYPDSKEYNYQEWKKSAGLSLPDSKAPKKPGMVFDGWWYTLGGSAYCASGNASLTWRDMVANDSDADLYLTAKYKEATVTIKYVSKGHGEVPNDETIGALAGETGYSAILPNGGTVTADPGYIASTVVWTNNVDSTWTYTGQTLNTAKIRESAWDGTVWRDITYTATFSPIHYWVKYVLDGGVGTAPDKYVAYDELFKLPSKNEVTKTGGKLVGWSTTLGALTPDTKTIWVGTSTQSLLLNEGNSRARNLTLNDGDTVELHAVYSNNGFEATFSDDSHGCINTIANSTQVVHQVVTDAFEPVKAVANAGYKFSHWEYVSLDGKKMSAALAASAFPAATYDATLGAYLPNTYDATLGAYVTVTTADFTLRKAPGDVWPDDAEFRAVFVPIGYTIHFEENGGVVTGAGVPDQSMVYDTAAKLNSNAPASASAPFARPFARSGALFLGWSRDATKTKATFDPTANPDDDFLDEQSVKNLANTDGTEVTLYAIYHAFTYRVVFYAGDANAQGGMAPQTFAADDMKTLSKNDTASWASNLGFVNRGYAADGWSTTPGGPKVYSDEELVWGLMDDAGDFPLYVNWVAGKYDVTFENSAAGSNFGYITPTNSGDRYVIKSVKYGTMVSSKNVPKAVKTALNKPYAYSYWSFVVTYDDGTTNSGTTNDPSTVLIEGTMVFTAEWEEYPPQAIIYDAGAHGGWAALAAGSYYMNANSTDLIAVDTPYNAGYDTLATNSKNVGRPLAEIGWRFTHWTWQSSNDGGVTYITYTDNSAYADGVNVFYKPFPTVVDGGYVFTAHQEATRQTVQFHKNGGEWQTAWGNAVTSDVRSVSDYTGQLIDLPTDSDLAMQGYKLLGWSADSTAKEPDNGWEYTKGTTVQVPMPAVDTLLYAVWGPKWYILHFDSMGGSYIPDRFVTWGQQDLLTSDDSWMTLFDGVDETPDGWPQNGAPSRPGYIFRGWYAAPVTTANPELLEFNKVHADTAFYSLAPYRADGVTKNDDEWVDAWVYAYWVEDISVIHYAVADASLNAFPEAGYITAPSGSVRESAYRELVGAATQMYAEGAVAHAYTGYKFVGWKMLSMVDDGMGGTVQVIVNVTDLDPNDPTIIKPAMLGVWASSSFFYAVFEPITYTVEFDANGGTGAIPDQVFRYGELQDLTWNEQKGTTPSTWLIENGGMKFLGWVEKGTTDPLYADGQSVKNLTDVDGGVVTLVAQWGHGNYRLTLYSSGAVEADRVEYHDGGDIVMLPGAGSYLFDDSAFQSGGVAKGWGWTYEGWALTANGERIALAGEKFAMPEADVELYVYWRPWTYYIMFETGASGVSGKMGTQTVDWSAHHYEDGGDSYVFLNDNKFRRLGYLFGGWATKPGGDAEYTNGQQILKPLATADGQTVRLYAVWPEGTRGLYSVSFDTIDASKGKITAATQYVWAGSQPDAAAVLEWQGDAGYLYIHPTTADWKLLGWTWKMTLDDGTVVEDNTISRDPDTITFELTYDDDGTPYTVNYRGVYGDTIMYAHWVPARSVTYLPGSHGAFLDITFKYLTIGAPAPAFNGPKDPVTKLPLGLHGWTFSHWTDANGVSYASTDKFPTLTDDGAVYTAHWIKSYTVQFRLDNGYATWKSDPGTITVSWKDWTAADPTIVLPQVGKEITVEGWVLDYWYPSNNPSATLAPGSQVVPPQVDVVYTAHWTAKPYTVIYKSDADSYAPLNGVTWHQDNLLPLNDPALPGSVFMGWFTKPNGGGTKVSKSHEYQKLVDNDNVDTLYLYAFFSQEYVTLHYKTDVDDNGTLLSNYQETLLAYADHNVAVGSEAIAVNDPVGYRFSGWYTSKLDSLGNLVIDKLVSTSRSILLRKGTGQAWVDGTTWIAHYEPIKYTIRYNKSAGAVSNLAGISGNVSDQVVVYGRTPFALKSNVGGYTAEGWIVDGWSVKPFDDPGYSKDYDFLETITSDMTTVSGDVIVLYAHWVPKLFKLHFDPGKGIGTVDASEQDQLYDVGDTPALPFSDNVVLMSRTGYEFDGWCDSAHLSGAEAQYASGGDAFIMPGEDTTLYAHWVPITYTVRFDAGDPDAVKRAADVLQNIAYTTSGLSSLNVSTLTMRIDYDSAFALPEALWTNGTTPLLGWSVPGMAISKTGKVLMNLASTDREVVITAIWSASKYFVTFADCVSAANAHGSVTSTPNPQIVTGGSGPDMSVVVATPNAGWYLSGWHYSMDVKGGAPVTGNLTRDDVGKLIITGDTVIAAIWSEAYTVQYTAGDTGRRFGTFTEGISGATLFASVEPGTAAPAYRGALDADNMPVHVVGYVFTGWAAYNVSGVLLDNYDAVDVSGSLVVNQSIELRAQWEPATYAITVKVDTSKGDELGLYGVPVSGGSTIIPNNQYLAYIDAAWDDDIQAIGHTGWTFSHWKYSGMKADGKPYSGTANALGDIVVMGPATVEAVFTGADPNDYVFVVFKGNGATGGSIANQRVDLDADTMLTSNTFVRDGYTFSGWMTTSSGALAWKPGDDVDYEDRGTIRFDSGAYAGNSQQVSVYVSLYAVWTPLKYTVTLTGDSVNNIPLKVGGTDMPSGHSFQVEYNVQIDPLWDGIVSFDVPAGKKFVKWHYQGTMPNGSSFKGDSNDLSSIFVLGDMTVSPVFEDDTNDLFVYVVFDGNGATGGSMAKQAVPWSVSTPLDSNLYTRNGYVFAGWVTTQNQAENWARGDAVSYVDGELVLFGHPDYQGDELVNLYAVWAERLYTVTMRVNAANGAALTYNGNEVAGGLSTFDVHYSEYFPLEEAQAYGCTGPADMRLKWWHYSGTLDDGRIFDGDVGDLSTIKVLGDVVVEPVFEPAYVYIVFHGNGENTGTMPRQRIELGVNETLDENQFIKWGYHIAYWTSTPDGEKVYDDKESILIPLAPYIKAGSEIPLYVHWEPSTYHVTVVVDWTNGENLYSNGSMHGVNQPYEFDSTYGEGVDPAHDGIVSATPGTSTEQFIGWHYEGTTPDGKTYSADVDSLANMVVLGDATVTPIFGPKWLPGVFVVFDGNGQTGGAMAKQHVPLGVPTALHQNLYTRYGYVFKGWMLSRSSANTWADGNPLDYEDMGLIQFDDPPYTGDLTEYVTLFAVWELDSFKVNVVVDLPGATLERGGTAVPGNADVISSVPYLSRIDSSYDRAFTVKPAPGYRFAGWKYAGFGKDDAWFGGVARSLSGIQVLGELTVTAMFEEAYVKVVFFDNGVDTHSTSQMIPVNTPTKLDKSGFDASYLGAEFAGWHVLTDWPKLIGWDSNNTSAMGYFNYTLDKTTPDYADEDTITLTDSFTGPNPNDPYVLYMIGVWRLKDYTITFKVNEALGESLEVGGTPQSGGVYSFTRPYTSSYAASATHADGSLGSDLDDEIIPVAPAGYVFSHWDITRTVLDGSKIKTLNTTSSYIVDYQTYGDVVFEAVFKPAYIYFVFDGNDETGGSMSPQLAALDGTITLDANQFERTGYTFAGWSYERDGIKQFSDAQTVYMKTWAKPDTSAGVNVTLWALWNPIPHYFVTFIPGSAAAPTWTRKVVEVIQGDPVPFDQYGEPDPVDPNLWEFAGWRYDVDTYADAADLMSAVPEVKSDMKITALWKSKVANVSFKPNGGIAVGDALDTVYGNAGDTIDLPGYDGSTVVYRRGWTFTGWNTSANGSGTGYAPDDAYVMKAGSSVLYAQWEETTVKVYWQAGPNGSITNTNLETSGSLFWLEIGADTGFVYASSVRTNKDVNNSSYTATGMADAGYIPLRWVDDNGNVVSTGYSSVKVTVPSSTSPVTRYVSSFGAVRDPETGLYVDGTVYTVEFVEMEPVKINYLTNPAGAGYLGRLNHEEVSPATGSPAGNVASANYGWQFVGWYRQSDTARVDPATGMPYAAALTTADEFIPERNDDGLYEGMNYVAWFIASPEAVSYTIEHWFEDEHGVYVNDTTLTEVSVGLVGETKTASAVSPIPLGWELNNSLSGEWSGVVRDTGLTLRMYYNRIRFTVTYVIAGSSLLPSVPTVPPATSHGWGAIVGVEPIPSLAGFTFNGWSTADATILPDGTFEMPERNVTLYGSFTPMKFTVSFDPNGATSLPSFTASVTADAGTHILLPLPLVDMQYWGHTFLGWAIDDAANGVALGLDANATSYVIPGRDVTLVALWETQKATIRYTSESYDRPTSAVAGTVVLINHNGVVQNTDNGKLVWDDGAYLGQYVDAVTGEVLDYYTHMPLNPVQASPFWALAQAHVGYHFVRWADANGQTVFGYDDTTNSYIYDASGNKVFEGVFLDAAGNVIPYASLASMREQVVACKLLVKRSPTSGLYETADYVAIFAENHNETVYYTVSDPNAGQVSRHSIGIAPNTGTSYGTVVDVNEGYQLLGWIALPMDSPYLESYVYTSGGASELRYRVKAGVTIPVSDGDFILTDGLYTSAGVTYVEIDHAPVPFPKGYKATRSKEDGLFHSMVYVAMFREAGSVSYTVKHYLEQEDGTFAEDESLRQVLWAKPGDNVTAIALSLAGYDYDPTNAAEVKSDTIPAGLDEGDNSGVVLELYYSVHRWKVTYEWASTTPAAVTSAVSLPTPNPVTGVAYNSTFTPWWPTTTVTGYVFKGWAITGAVTNTTPAKAMAESGDTFLMPDNDVVLTGIWEPLPYTVRFLPGNDNITEHGTVAGTTTQTVYYGGNASTADIVVTPTDATQYVAWGWVAVDPSATTTTYLYGSSSAKPIMDPSTIAITQDTDFIVNWIVPFTVNYRPDDASHATWTSGTPNKTQFTGLTPAHDIATYAQYADKVDANGDPEGASPYTFVGWRWQGKDGKWHTTVPATHAKHTAGDIDETGLPTYADYNYDFFAVFVGAQSTLSFELNKNDYTGTDDKYDYERWAGGTWLATDGADADGTAPASQTKESGQTTTLPGKTSAVRPGYHMDGWATSADGGAVYYLTATGAGPTFTFGATDVVLYPHWVEDAAVTIQYLVESGQNGTAIVTGTTNASVETVAPASGTAAGADATAGPGYTLTGGYWYDRSDSSKTPLSYNAHFDPAKVNGAYKTATYVFHFEKLAVVEIKYRSEDTSKGTVSLASESVQPIGGTAQGSTATARPGYHFVNWTDENGTVFNTPSLNPPLESGAYVAHTYTAHFDADDDTPYTVRHVFINQDEVLQDEIYETGSSALVTANGWTLDTTLVGTTGSTATASAKTVAFYLYDATYDTSNWKTVATGTIKGDGSTILTLIYVMQGRQLTFVVADYDDRDEADGRSKGYWTSGTADKSGVYGVGASITMPDQAGSAKDVNRVGYTLLGWSENSGATSPDTGLTPGGTLTMPNRDVTLYPVWQANDDITFKVLHYQQNLTGGGYTLVDTDSYSNGTSGATLYVSTFVKSYTGYVIADATYTDTLTTTAAKVPGFSVTTGTGGSMTVAGSVTVDQAGNLVLNLYYDLRECKITFTKGAEAGVAWTSSVTPDASDHVVRTGKLGESVTMLDGLHIERTGYTLTGWKVVGGAHFGDPAESIAVDGADYTLEPEWQADSNIKYNVYHWWVFGTGATATETLHETENKTGYADNMVALSLLQKSYAGFLYDHATTGNHATGSDALVPATTTSVKVAADGSLIVNLFYNAQTCTIKFFKGDGANITWKDASTDGVTTPYVLSGYTSKGIPTTGNKLPGTDLVERAGYDLIGWKVRSVANLDGTAATGGVSAGATFGDLKTAITFDGYNYELVPEWEALEIEYKVEIILVKKDGTGVQYSVTEKKAKVDTLVDENGTGASTTIAGYTYDATYNAGKTLPQMLVQMLSTSPLAPASSPSSVMRDVFTLASGTVTAAPELVLTLAFVQDEYTVTWDPNGGTWIGALASNGTGSYVQTGKVAGDTITVLDETVLERLGYSFATMVWDMYEVNGTKKLVKQLQLPADATFTMPASNVLLVANWMANPTKYYVEYFKVPAGGSPVLMETKDYLADTGTVINVETTHTPLQVPTAGLMPGYKIDLTYAGTVKSGTVTVDPVTRQGDLVLKLFFVPVKHTVTLDAWAQNAAFNDTGKRTEVHNDWETSQVVDLPDGTKVTHVGYKLLGWTLDAAPTTASTLVGYAGSTWKWQMPETDDANITLNAVWEPLTVTFTVRYWKVDSTGKATQFITERVINGTAGTWTDDEGRTLYLPTVNGYTHLSTTTENMTFADDSHVDASKTYAYTVTKHNDENGTQVTGLERALILGDSSLVLDIYYAADAVKLVLDKVEKDAVWDSGSVWSPNGVRNLHVDDAVVLPGSESTLANGAELTWTGYKLLGWSKTKGATKPDAGMEAGDTWTIGVPASGGTITLYAVWEPLTRPLVYHPWVEGHPSLADADYKAEAADTTTGVKGSIPTVDHAVGSSVSIASSSMYAWKGWTLTGWVDNAGNTYAKDGDTYTMISGDNDLWAVWEAKKYTVEYWAPTYSSLVAGNYEFALAETRTVKWNDIVEALDDVHVIGHEWFDWWLDEYFFTDTVDGVSTYADYITGGDDTQTVLKVYGDYVAREGTVVFHVEGGETEIAPIYNVGWFDTGFLPSNPRWLGHMFFYWENNEDEGFGDEIDDDWTFANAIGNDDSSDPLELHLYARWLELEYTVSFDSNGGSDIADMSGIMWGGDGFAFYTPSKPNAVFLGWWTGSGAQKDVADSDIRVDGSTVYSSLVKTDTDGQLITLHARWLEIDSSDANGAVAYSFTPNGTEGTLTLTATPASSYELSGWTVLVQDDTGTYQPYTDYEFEGNSISFTVSGSVKVAASFSSGSDSNPVAASSVDSEYMANGSTGSYPLTAMGNVPFVREAVLKEE